MWYREHIAHMQVGNVSRSEWGEGGGQDDDTRCRREERPGVYISKMIHDADGKSVLVCIEHTWMEINK